jgi:hypothetical protein
MLNEEGIALLLVMIMFLLLFQRHFNPEQNLTVGFILAQRWCISSTGSDLSTEILIVINQTTITVTQKSEFMIQRVFINLFPFFSNHCRH